MKTKFQGCFCVGVPALLKSGKYAASWSASACHPPLLISAPLSCHGKNAVGWLQGRFAWQCNKPCSRLRFLVLTWARANAARASRDCVRSVIIRLPASMAGPKNAAADSNAASRSPPPMALASCVCTACKEFTGASAKPDLAHNCRLALCSRRPFAAQSHKAAQSCDLAQHDPTENIITSRSRVSMPISSVCHGAAASSGTVDGWSEARPRREVRRLLSPYADSCRLRADARR